METGSFCKVFRLEYLGLDSTSFKFCCSENNIVYAWCYDSGFELCDPSGLF